MYWLIVFLNNFNDYICSAIAVNYYWTAKIQNMRVFCHTLGHTIGTIALTIVILPACIIKSIFCWLEFFVDVDKPNFI